MAITPTTAWDETAPAGSQSVSLGDDRIREMKTQLREVIAVDHKMGSSGNDADNGKHNQVSLLEKSDIGTGANGKPILGAQTVSSKPELVYTNEDDVDIQITTGTKINTAALDTTLAAFAGLMALVYPVGVVVTLGVSTNPGTLFGVGTWTAIAGKVIVGIDAGQTEFDTLDETGGAKTHTLTTPEMPAHTHTMGVSANEGVTNNYAAAATVSADATATTDSTGGGGAHNNLQPYIVKYVWQRTA